MKILFLLLSTFLYSAPVIIVTLPKSGTTYTYATLRKFFSTPESTRDQACIHNTLNVANLLRLNTKYPKGFPVVNHYSISDKLLSDIVKHNWNVVFIARNPVEAATTRVVRHFLNSHQGTYGRPFFETPPLHDLSIYFHKHFPEQFTWYCKHLTKWSKWAHQYPNHVHIVPFTLLKEDPLAFMKRILSPFGHAHSFTKQHLIPLQQGKHRYSGGLRNEYLSLINTKEKRLISTTFTPALQQLCK